MGRPRRGNDAQQAAVVAHANEHGLAAAAEHYRLPKSTIRTWVLEASGAKTRAKTKAQVGEGARAAEPGVFAPTPVVSARPTEPPGDPRWAQQREAAAASAARRRVQLEQSRERQAAMLVSAAELALRRTLERLQDPEQAAQVPMRELVGAWTRAIHDGQLLLGEATERTEDVAAMSEEQMLAEFARLHAEIGQRAGLRVVR